MDTPNFLLKQFMASTFLNTEFQALTQSIAQAMGNLTGAGFVNGQLITIAASGTTATVTFDPSVLAVFNTSGTYKVSGPYGVTDGANSAVYSVSLASLIPGSGTQTVYLYASYDQIGQVPGTAPGPPQQHPDWNAGATPTSGFNIERDSFTVVAATAIPAGGIEIASLTLSSAGAITNVSQLRSGIAPLALKLLDQFTAGTVTGTANALVVDLPINPVNYAAMAGVPFTAVPAQTNTGAATININGLGATPVVVGGSALLGGEMVAGIPQLFIYQNGAINIVNPNMASGSNANGSWIRQRNGLITQMGSGSTVTGYLDSYSFPIPFTTSIKSFVVCESNATGWGPNSGTPVPTLYGYSPSGNLSHYLISCVHFFNGGIQYHGSSAFNWIAEGF